jgi:PhnB protein
MTSSRLNPYLHFNGDARQAMEFYKSVFGGELTLSTYGESGMADSPDASKVMHAQLETGAGYTLMGSDAPSHIEYTAMAGVSMSLSGDDGDTLRGYWDKLSSAGTVTMPLEKQAWGDEFGMVTDQFGVDWMVNISQPQQ